MEVIVFFFFFQAEDGIRDLTVTGVQTCALPIFRARDALEDAIVGHEGHEQVDVVGVPAGLEERSQILRGHHALSSTRRIAPETTRRQFPIHQAIASRDTMYGADAEPTPIRPRARLARYWILRYPLHRPDRGADGPREGLSPLYR